jgi:DNA ligase-4
MGDTLDLLILAGYYGDGRRRSGQLASFLVGVKAPPGAALVVGGGEAGGMPLLYLLVKVRAFSGWKKGGEDVRGGVGGVLPP